ncbi:hypothetical protein [Eudoraea adriatica]|uniref:hypothetical protein n=1 Tax=Eudoraea adriatica TaxID=446681 RepID=UPI0012FB65A5|nr:hypothetical protein [Eudoraea adriatica]
MESLPKKRTLNTTVYTLEEVESGLITACTSFNASLFLPFLKSAVVKTKMPNKMRFYSFFKLMLYCTKQSSVGPLRVKKGKGFFLDGKGAYSLQFYDSIHKYSRLNIEIQETENAIFIETLPF